MKKPLVPFLLVLAAVLAAPAVAQENEGEANDSGQERILRAIHLPRTTREARQAGVAEEELRKVLRMGREQRVPPAEMDVVLQEEVRAVKEHGPIDNFGAFVQERMRQGLRGRDLAAAIRAEHAARGKGGRGGKGGLGGKAGGPGAKMKKGAGPHGAEEAGDQQSGKAKGKRQGRAKKGDDR